MQKTRRKQLKAKKDSKRLFRALVRSGVYDAHLKSYHIYWDDNELSATPLSYTLDYEDNLAIVAIHILDYEAWFTEYPDQEDTEEVYDEFLTFTRKLGNQPIPRLERMTRVRNLTRRERKFVNIIQDDELYHVQ